MNDDPTIRKGLIITSSHLSQLIHRNRKFMPFEKTNVNMRFLSIQYVHPNMKPIYIDLPVGYFMYTNEILSSVFVKRCLEYQSQPYVFDNMYTLHIIDHKVFEFSLSSSQYIRLDKDTYHVIEEETI